MQARNDSNTPQGICNRYASLPNQEILEAWAGMEGRQFPDHEARGPSTEMDWF